MINAIPASQRWLTLLWALVLTLTVTAQDLSPTPAPPLPPPAPPTTAAAPTPPAFAPAPPLSPPPTTVPPAPTPAPVPNPPPGSEPVPTTPAPVPAPTPPVAAPSPAAPQPPGSNTGVYPADFLDTVGRNVKARWRQLYRESPPVASPERMRVAFTLGCLMAESHLAVQAGDGQQFRNNNQEIQKLSNLLGIADKVSSDLNAGSKMAEGEDWPALRKQVLQTQQRIEAVLNEQRDEDLAILMDVGLWVRLFDISTTLAHGDPDLKDKNVCIGSLAMLNELAVRYERLSATAQSNEAIAVIGGVLEMLQRHWASPSGNPAQDIVEMTHGKLRFLINKVEAK